MIFYVRLLRINRDYSVISDSFRFICEENGREKIENLPTISLQFSSASYLKIISMNIKPLSWIFSLLVNERNLEREPPLPCPVHFRRFPFLPELRDDCFLRRVSDFPLYCFRTRSCLNLRLRKIRIL